MHPDSANAKTAEIKRKQFFFVMVNNKIKNQNGSNERQIKNSEKNAQDKKINSLLNNATTTSSSVISK